MLNSIKKANKEQNGLLICADTNAHSTSWGNKDTNERGAELETILAKYNLTIRNGDFDPTYHKGDNHTTIDLMITNQHTLEMKKWAHSTKDTLSDHDITSNMLISIILHIRAT